MNGQESHDSALYLKCNPKIQDSQLEIRSIDDNDESIAVLGYRRCREYDSRNGEGQDYTLLFSKGNRVFLILADGVSQSFYGQIAAQRVVGGLASYLEQDNPFDALPEAREALICELRNIAQRGARDVQAYKVPDNLSADMRAVLERARSEGSQAVFGVAVYDRVSRRLVVGQIGDVRIRVFRESNAGGTLSISHCLVKTNPMGRFSTVATARSDDQTLLSDLVIDVFEGVVGVLLHSDGADDKWGETVAALDRERKGDLSEAFNRWAVKDDVSVVGLLSEPLRRWAAEQPFVLPPEPPQISGRFGTGTIAISSLAPGTSPVLAEKRPSAPSLPPSKVSSPIGDVLPSPAVLSTRTAITSPASSMEVVQARNSGGRPQAHEAVRVTAAREPVPIETTSSETTSSPGHTTPHGRVWLLRLLRSLLLILILSLILFAIFAAGFWCSYSRILVLPPMMGSSQNTDEKIGKLKKQIDYANGQIRTLQKRIQELDKSGQGRREQHAISSHLPPGHG